MFQSESHLWGKLASELLRCQDPAAMALTGSAAMALTFEKWPVKLSKVSLEKCSEVSSLMPWLSHDPGSLDT